MAREHIILPCSSCGEDVVASDEDVVKVYCGICIAKALYKDYLSDLMSKPKSMPNRPSNWMTMPEYVTADGEVFHHGVEQPELKGTLNPTTFKAGDIIGKKKPIKKNVVKLDELSYAKKVAEIRDSIMAVDNEIKAEKIKYRVTKLKKKRILLHEELEKIMRKHNAK